MSIDEPRLLVDAIDYDQKRLKEVLDYLNDQYRNYTAVVSDETYDDLLLIYNRKFPSQPYSATIIKEVVGRRGEQKVSLPYYLPSLRKIKTEKEVDAFCKRYPGPYVVEDKVDGMTLLYVCQIKDVDSVVKKIETLYTHSGEDLGYDVSHVIPYLRIPNVTFDISVRGEAMIFKRDFEEVGKGKAKARGMVSGILNSKASFDPEIASRLHFLSYNILNSTENPCQQILKLRSLGFETPYVAVATNLTKEMLKSTFLERERKADYEIDGLAVYHNQYFEPTKEDPKHIVAFKHDKPPNRTVVTHVEWNASKIGLLKPIVHFEPIQFPGAVVSKATGYNAAFIISNGIAPGTVITVIRSGEVIPKIVDILERRDPQFPSVDIHGPYLWNESQVELVLMGENDQTRAAKIEHFLNKVGVRNMGPARVRSLVEAGYDTIEKVVTINSKQLQQLDRIGEVTAEKLVAELRDKTRNVPLANLMAASCIFSHFSEKRFQAIIDVYPDLLTWDTIKNGETLKQNINAIDGFGAILSEEFIDAFPYFKVWLSNHTMITFIDPMSHLNTNTDTNSTMVSCSNPIDHPLKGKKIVFSGKRNKAVEDMLKAAGGIVQSAISGKTDLLVLFDISDGKGKLADAQKLGVKFTSMDQFITTYFPTAPRST